MPTNKKIGRPTRYTSALAEEICNAIACTSAGLKKLCNDNKHWPERRNIYHWLKKHEEFRLQYAHAKTCQIETLIDEILDIADDTSNDTIIKIDSEGNEKVICNSEWINRSRLRIDSRKWLASKLAPKIYGDRAYIESRIDDTNFSIENMDWEKITPAQAKIVIEKLLTRFNVSPE